MELWKLIESNQSIKEKKWQDLPPLHKNLDRQDTYLTGEWSKLRYGTDFQAKAIKSVVTANFNRSSSHSCSLITILDFATYNEQRQQKSLHDNPKHIINNCYYSQTSRILRP